MNAIAAASVRAGRYGRSVCSVLKQSAIARIRAPSGMASPRRLDG
jgi:hypothetical protein